MREIKFRAWDGKNMYYNHSVTLQIDGTVVYLTPLGYWIEDSEGLIKLMQYTGIKDKNGKGIYEGDVVNCYNDAAKDPSWGLDNEHKGVIEYNGNSFCLNINGLYLDQWIYAENIEVIGNIHEPNPITKCATN